MSVGSDTATPVQAPGGGALERFFKFKANGTTLRRDTLAGLTTFMVMANIIFVNPSILSFAGIKALEPRGLPFAAVLTSTCLVAAVTTLIMGLFTNRAYALAPGLGINAVVAFSLVAADGLTMKAAMGIVVMEGIVITILVLAGLREAIFRADRRRGAGQRDGPGAHHRRLPHDAHPDRGRGHGRARAVRRARGVLGHRLLRHLVRSAGRAHHHDHAAHLHDHRRHRRPASSRTS